MYFLFSGRLLGRNTTSFSYLGAPATRTFSLDMALGSLLRQPGWTKALLPTRLRRALGSRLRAWNRVKPPALEPALRADLTLGYREELLRLQDLIGRDLGHWLVAP